MWQRRTAACSAQRLPKPSSVQPTAPVQSHRFVVAYTTALIQGFLEVQPPHVEIGASGILCNCICRKLNTSLYFWTGSMEPVPHLSLSLLPEDLQVSSAQGTSRSQAPKTDLLGDTGLGYWLLGRLWNNQQQSLEQPIHQRES